jgi:hypothetical protein
MTGLYDGLEETSFKRIDGGSKNLAYQDREQQEAFSSACPATNSSSEAVPLVARFQNVCNGGCVFECGGSEFRIERCNRCAAPT